MKNLILSLRAIRQLTESIVIFFILDCFVISFLAMTHFFPSPVFAHILKSDGSIGAIIHIDPEDDPIAGEASGFYFEFKDKQNKFSPQNCDCTVSIIRHHKEVYSQPLFQNNSDPIRQLADNASFTYTFPEKDVYQVKVIGKPLVSDAFHPFTLEYDIRVAREVGGSQSHTDQSLPIVPMIIGGLVIFFIAIFLIKKTKKSHLISLFLLLFLSLYVYPAHLSLPHHHHSQPTHEEYYSCTAAYTSDVVPLISITPDMGTIARLKELILSPQEQISFEILRIRSPPQES